MTIMKKYIYRIFCGLVPALLILFTTTSCSDDLNYELFTKYTYLLKNGWQGDIAMNLTEQNTVNVNVAFGVNGTTSNNKDVNVTLAVDPDTLRDYNFDKNKNDSAAYYTILPADCYQFDKTSYTIPAGQLNAAATVTVDMTKLANNYSIYDQYVLPIKIASSDGEVVGPSKYSRALYLINLVNSWSGAYSGTGTLKAIYKKKIGSRYQDITYTGEVSGKRLYAVSNKECYMYAGSYERNTKHHAEFVVRMTMNADSTITMTSPVDADKFQPISAYYTFKFTQNSTDSRKLNRMTVLYTHYKYIDTYTDPDITEPYEYEGTLSRNDVVYKKDYPDAVISAE
jgi:hypothetical protein